MKSERTDHNFNFISKSEHKQKSKQLNAWGIAVFSWSSKFFFFFYKNSAFQVRAGVFLFFCRLMAEIFL